MATSSTTSVSAASDVAFTQSVGVAAHISSSMSSSQLISELSYLGITNVRTGIPESYELANFTALAKAGIHFVLFESNLYASKDYGVVDATADVARAAQLWAAVPGSITALEGTNEYTS